MIDNKVRESVCVHGPEVKVLTNSEIEILRDYFGVNQSVIAYNPEFVRAATARKSKHFDTLILLTHSERPSINIECHEINDLLTQMSNEGVW